MSSSIGFHGITSQYGVLRLLRALLEGICRIVAASTVVGQAVLRGEHLEECRSRHLLEIYSLPLLSVSVLSLLSAETDVGEESPSLVSSDQQDAPSYDRSGLGS